MFCIKCGVELSRGSAVCPICGTKVCHPDFPADDSFFLCEFTGVIPPAIVTPMEKGRLLAALGSEVSGGLTGTISLQ